MSQTYMNNIIEQQWRDAIEALAPTKDSKDERESLAMDYISTDIQAHNKSADWVILAFQNVIQEIHERFDLSRQTARLFDERIRDVKKDNPQEIPSLEVLSRFLTEFSAELAIRLPPSFDHVAYLYFETIFQQYEESYPRKPESDCNVDDSDWNNPDETSSGMDQQRKVTGYDNDRQNDSNGQQDPRQLGRKRRRVMQDGRFAMDLFVDDMDDELVEQIFHGVHGAASVGSQENDTQMQGYLSLCQMLEDIGFAAHMTDVVTRMLYKKVERKIFGSFKKEWRMPTLDRGKDWMSYVVLPFLRHTLLPKKDQEDTTGRKRYKMWASRLEFYFFKTFGDLRIKEFFDIIVEHPDSTPAVLDLSTCIKWTGQRDQLQNAIVAATRDDTMRAIVSCIVDDSNDLLTNTAEGIQVNADLDDERSDDDSWVPEPVNAGPDLSSARRRMADIISVLANIYDTNDRFIKEFQAILADRLLQATDFQVDREVRQLELLKLRFGETDLQHCEVMLADVAESKRVNANIQSLNPNLNVSATIASRYYWPEIENEELKLPDVFQQLLESYSNAFEVSKPAQKLAVFPSLGMVELELEFTNRTLNIQVEPIQAAIIHCFEDLDTWALTDISAKLQVPEETLEQKIQFWVREGVLREVNRLQYQLVENI
ncbi:Anaphase-promoting complex subunit 2 [Entomortierella chlamydospora]|uniref:Anaphase-promoting complex subunit 2 n=1 Tax=Entomortierella chlamydospora TaxID=101097 RepID=A0A9P6MYR2_9FUNG|nr:Anaphase-promoting complex subunit 2 [Entomortierella chlamydospora]